jgi:hypothetical protein
MSLAIFWAIFSSNSSGHPVFEFRTMLTESFDISSGLPDVLFSNKNPTLGKWWRVLQCWYILWPFGLFYGHWKYFMVILYILWSFGIVFPVWYVLYQEKSGNPASAPLFRRHFFGRWTVNRVASIFRALFFSFLFVIGKLFWRLESRNPGNGRKKTFFQCQNQCLLSTNRHVRDNVIQMRKLVDWEKICARKKSCHVVSNFWSKIFTFLHQKYHFAIQIKSIQNCNGSDCENANNNLEIVCGFAMG